MSREALSPPRRVLLPALALASLFLLVTATGASADLLTPESGGSPNADAIDWLYKFVFAIGIVVFIGVESLLIYTLVKYRHKRSNPEPAQIRGNTRLEIGWTLGAAVIVVVIAAVTFLQLPEIRTPPPSGPLAVASVPGTQYAATDQPPVPGGRALTIDVTGLQYLWRYNYPQGVYSYYEMVVPTDTTVVLQITSQDVIHSWWIPKLGGKFDAVPGHTSDTWFKIADEGVYDGQCAELCGENHAQMYGRVRAVSPAAYRGWIARQAAALRQSQQQLAAARQARGGAQ